MAICTVLDCLKLLCYSIRLAVMKITVYIEDVHTSYSLIRYFHIVPDLFPKAIY